MTANRTSPDLAVLALVVRRMAHDLASPLGALMTALDLSGEADPLAGAAAEGLRARLAFWRALAGILPDEPADATALAEGLAAEAARTAGRTIDVSALQALPPRLQRAAAALALQGLGLLAGPGRVRADVEGDRLHVRVEGRIAGRDGLSALASGAIPGASHQAPAALVAAMGFRLQILDTPEGLMLCIPLEPWG